MMMTMMIRENTGTNVIKNIGRMIVREDIIPMTVMMMTDVIKRTERNHATILKRFTEGDQG